MKPEDKRVGQRSVDPICEYAPETSSDSSSAAGVAARPALARPAWQPIETAPKDGTAFIALDKHGGVGKAHWSERYRPHAWATDDEMFYVDITHWLALPPPPDEPEK